jgi:hypothetical protein
MRTIREVLRLKFDPTEFGDDHVRQGDQFGPWKLSRIKSMAIGPSRGALRTRRMVGRLRRGISGV